ncbi:acyl-CoA dehydrogenase [Oceanobacillus profundus]|uniref:Acyl-CoA dehydrogenase n=1 Tax=Oceanobacillus profundus TaxID=372463 RepID=A0A417YNX1_9BACI|nr:acyl-CoA dehydrogenase [Oceanobacillus profundus]MBR3118182.1 acyl-CoA dehydrogenase [Oceanobacillus sp.]MDO6450100.1 acyl-CoA dehydrogenase [Oceanobacillus profundus]PAE30572.1 acyl-CoA dehydrogenase [Paenibacillus sp. 7884-2]RHW35426.1 acyl-CoA dehydrogenase [Oceanobacillus profundus]
MMLKVTEEQEMLLKVVRDFARKEVAPVIERMEKEDRFPIEIVKKMGELGLMGIPIPEKYGGSGMDFTSYIQTIHELSKVSATVGVILSVHTSVGTNPILYFGNEEQKRRFLPRLASGEYLGAFALTEPGAGSDAGSLKTTAKETDVSYILNGSKVFITNGGVADTYITFARTGDNSKDISAFIVEKDSPGLIIGKKEKKMGLHGSNTVQLTFDQCVIPKGNLLGEKGSGFNIAMANLNIGRIGIAAQGLGIAEAALEYAVNYAKERKQFGKSIASNQGISFKLADMATATESAKLLTYHAATLIEQGVPCAKETSMAKLAATRTAMNNAIEAIQIFGGYGYTEEYPVERLFRDAKVTEIYEGTNEIQHIVIANHLLKD